MSAALDLHELFRTYLQSQVAAMAGGTASPAVLDVIPHESRAEQPVDARVAWEEGLMPLTLQVEAFKAKGLPVPSDWPSLVVQSEPATGLACAIANFPQRVYQLQPLMQARPPLPASGPSRLPSLPMLADWARAALDKPFPQPLLALGVMRLAQAWDVIPSQSVAVPSEWADAWANEQAAILWHKGQAAEAVKEWKTQKLTIPVRFNLGMSALFMDKFSDARTHLAEVVRLIPETSSWHHLAALYLTLADTRN